MKRLFAALALVVCLAVNAQGGKEVTCTTTDLKQAYSILKVVTGFSTMSSLSDAAFAKAYSEAWSKLAYEASKVDADAVVGIKIEQLKSADGKSDKLIVYGTAVKTK